MNYSPMYTDLKTESKSKGKTRRLAIFSLAVLSMVGCAYLLFGNNAQTEMDSESSNASEIQSLHITPQMTVPQVVGFLKQHDAEQTTKLQEQANTIRSLRDEIEKLKYGPGSAYVDSNILPNEQQRINFQNMVGKADPGKLKLLYRGTRDGFQATSFHRFVDNQGPTITVYKTTTGAIFGGYTDIPWSTQGGYHRQHGNSFLFKESNENFRVLKFLGSKGATNQEVYHTANTLAYFEWAIHVYSMANGGGTQSWTQIKNYETPAELSGNAAIYYLNNGVRNFHLAEVETFKVL